MIHVHPFLNNSDIKVLLFLMIILHISQRNYLASYSQSPGITGFQFDSFAYPFIIIQETENHRKTDDKGEKLYSKDCSLAFYLLIYTSLMISSC